MSDTSQIPADILITETPEDIVTPQPVDPMPDGPTDEPTEPRFLSAAERVRERVRQARGSAAGEPSATPSGPRAPGRAPAPPKPREGSLVKPLTDLYTTIGACLAPIDPVCSLAFINNAEECARSMENLARENESVRRIIIALTQTSVWGTALVAHLPIILVIVMHHGPPQVAERVAPMAWMMNPQAMQQAAAAAAAQQQAQEAPSDAHKGASDGA